MDEGEKWIPTKKDTYDIYCKKNESLYLYNKCMNSPGSSTISIQPSSGGEINFGTSSSKTASLSRRMTIESNGNVTVLNSMRVGSDGLPSATLHVDGDLLSNDLILSNLEKDTPNEVDGTRGHWCIQEGAEDLFIINRQTGKKYKFNLSEVQ